MLIHFFDLPVFKSEKQPIYILQPFFGEHIFSLTFYSILGTSAVIYSNEEIGFHDNTYDGVAFEENTYEGVDLPPATVMTSKPPIQPRVQSQNTNGKPVAVVRPERPEPKAKPPPQPKPYDLYSTEKAGSNASLDDVNVKQEMGKKDEKPLIVPRALSKSQENQDKGGREEVESGDIYQNVTVPGVVLATELEEYIKSKKNGSINELAHEFNVSITVHLLRSRKNIQNIHVGSTPQEEKVIV